ncbi:MAG TPA: hypothetical protein VEU62_14625 [Bryobacterales bacterium]|nr:hypothetical protein [Bryobacterales bacterium]
MPAGDIAEVQAMGQAAAAAERDRAASPAALYAVLAALSLGLLAFAVVAAPPWNEGIHLVAARLINAGKKPYVDFFYQHTPINIYLTAAWMRLFGETWRSAGALAALWTAGSIVLAAEFLWSRLDHPAWRSATAMTGAILLGLDALVFRFGSIAQAFGLCLFLLVLAFRLAIVAVDREKGLLAVGAGLCAGAAAASSLLAAPAAPILLFWMAGHNRAGSRADKCARFLGGVLVSWLPVLWLAAQAPRRVFFDLAEYHLVYRHDQIGSSAHELRVLGQWLDSSQVLFLILLAATGILFLMGQSGWPRPRRSELHLCLWLAGGLAALAACANPTFSGYFVLAIPFLAILAAVGFYAIGSRLWAPRRPVWLVLLAAGFFTLGTVKWFYQFRSIFRHGWQQYESVAEQINRVTPANGTVYTLPEIYFAARRTPPRGLENPFSSYLPPAAAAEIGEPTAAEIDRWLASGRFATVVTGDGAKDEALGLPRLYAKRAQIGGYEVFWERVGPAPQF